MTKTEENKLIASTDAWDNWDEYAFGEGWEVNFTIPTITHDIWPKSNQSLWKKSNSACTIIWSWNQIIRLFGLDLDMKDSNKIWDLIVDYCTQFWYVIGKWWSTPDAINTVCKWWNTYWYKEFWKEKVFYCRVIRWDPRIKEALNKWHCVWMTYRLNWNTDKYAGLVYKDDYPVAKTWHRTNIKAPKFINATSWLKLNEWEANEWVHDNYYMHTNEYYIKDISKYVNKWVYPAFYLLLPQSCLIGTVEQNKQLIAETKATNALIWVMTSTWADVPEKYQKLSANYAAELRKDYEWARPLYSDQTTKVMQSVVDMLSYSYKYADSKYQEKFASLAAEMRKDFWLK